MRSNFSYNRRQLLPLATVFFLSPALRLVPSGTAELAGRAAWVSVPAALPMLLLYMFFLSRFLARRHEGESLAELSLRALGPRLGRAVLFVLALWFLVYGGFMLRSGAVRIITTIYPNSSPELFIISMGLLGLYAALGAERTLVRSAKIIKPAVIAVLILVLSFSLVSVQRENLLPLTVFDAAGTFKGSLASLGVACVSVYMCFFLGGLECDSKGFFRDLALWSLATLGLLFWLNTAIIGSFGAELTTRLSQPFFALIRNLVFFRSLERVEALVVSLWIFSDFILISLCLQAAQRSLRRTLGFDADYTGQSLTDLGSGRFLIWLCGISAIVFGCLIAREPESLEFWSRQLIPGVNLTVALLVLPCIYIIGRLRNRI